MSWHLTLTPYYVILVINTHKASFVIVETEENFNFVPTTCVLTSDIQFWNKNINEKFSRKKYWIL